jgi:hypothetical protein
VQQPSRRHPEGGGAVDGDQECQVPAGGGDGSDLPTYIGFRDFPDTR